MKKKKRTKLLVFLLLVVVLLGALDVKIIFDRYVWAGGGFRARAAQLLDLRDEALSFEEYADLTEKLPDAKILWCVPFDHARIPCDTAAITVSVLTAENVAQLEYFEDLSELTAAECRDYAALNRYHAAHPDCVISCGAVLSGQSIAPDSTAITLENPNAAQLTEQLPYLTKLESAELTGELPDAQALLKLRQDFPQVDFRWQVSLGSGSVDSTSETLDLSGQSLDYGQVQMLLRQMPQLRTVNLKNSSLGQQQIMQLAQEFPDCSFLFDLTFAGQTFSTDIEELDISDYSVSGPEEVEAVLPYFSNLKRVIMCRCGLDDETMDALNRRHEDIRFVWSFLVKNVELRTDILWFYPYKYNQDMTVSDKDLIPLRYCEDMQCIDIGHNWDVTNIEFVRNMPNLKYLILVGTRVTDLSPLENAKNLLFLEIFYTSITDYTPLLGCTALEDLNLSETYGPEEPILEMTWLKNLWWGGIDGKYGKPCADAPAKLQEALPNTNMKFHMNSPCWKNGWRLLDNYFAMRDLMDVFYLE